MAIERKKREFNAVQAVKTRVPLWAAFVGPSGSGKTYSALRLAHGMQKVTGGRVALVDTENGRALHYADPSFGFNFLHVPMDAPFSPLDYQDVLEYLAGLGDVSVVVIDSGSHEHEGPGGVLEWHAAEVQRLQALWSKGQRQVSAEAVNFPAWAVPKAAHRKMLQTALRLPLHVIWCFRAKEKLKIENSKPKDMGWMAIAAEDLVYEMTFSAFFMPGAEGKPTWKSESPGTSAQIKRPGWATAIMGDRQVDEAMGEALAKWAEGTKIRTVSELVADYRACVTPAQFGALEMDRKTLWQRVTSPDRAQLKQASDEAKARLDAAVAEESRRFEESMSEAAAENADPTPEESSVGWTKSSE